MIARVLTLFFRRKKISQGVVELHGCKVEENDCRKGEMVEISADYLRELKIYEQAVLRKREVQKSYVKKKLQQKSKVNKKAQNIISPSEQVNSN